MVKPDYTSLDLPSPPAGRPYVILNMVMSVDGKIVVDGTEQGLGSKVDQRLMRELRVHADVVLNGAETLRQSGASPKLDDPLLEQLRMNRGKPRLPIGCILSRSGDLPLKRSFFTSDEFQAVVYLSEAAGAKRREAIEATGRPVVVLPAGEEVPAMLRHMRQELRARVLLLEGGATVNRQFFDVHAVDEVFLTIGPRIVGGAATLTPVEGDEPYSHDELRHLLLVSAVPNEVTGELYLRYRLQH
jgi:riboflavin biosynthesis pyrimidine reductase